MKTLKRHEDLAQSPRPGSWDAIRWGALARTARAIAPLSDGMRLGYRYGFDSGPMLDYVYRNRASGRLGIGVLLDRAYLNAIGWRAIRQRKANLRVLLRESIGWFHIGRQPVHIVDIAAGPGRYLLEVLDELRAPTIQATLRDWDETGLAEGRRLAQSMGLTAVRYQRGDAFDPEDLRRVSPRPHVAVVSGLYELFPDNEPIQRSLQGLARLLVPGGHLIYTNQPYHPQLELIARCLPNREGKPWVMRLRSQEEMDRLVREAGFVVHKRLIDQWGMYTVSVAATPADQ